MIDHVIEIARKASEEILKVYEKADLGVEYKADDSPLTEADKRAHELITRELENLDGNIPVISEESADIPFSERSSWKKLWLVDPLDGTKEFIKRNGEFTVNIALIENGEPVFGVISIPVRGHVYYGQKDGGAFFVDDSGAKKRPLKTDSSGRRPVIAVSRSHLSPGDESLIASLGAETISAGSALKFALVAEGGADIYSRFGPTWEWDTAAGHAVAAAAGAVVMGLRGEPLLYNKEVIKHEGFIVCIPELREKLTRQVKKINEKA
jgi:3'(2'), 5'-bisphosphate nucleotidase